MYNANLPEKLIQERTGHQNLKALRQYECTSEPQLVEVSNIISSTSDKVQVSTISSAPVLSSILCNEPKMTICRHDTAVSQKSDEMIIPMQQGVPNIGSVLKGCNFNNYVVNFSNRSTDKSHCNYASSYQAAELLEGINIDKLFDD